MTAIPFPVSSAPGLKPQEGAGQLINCRAEKTEQGARFPVVWRRAAGLRELADAGGTRIHLRGAIAINNALLCVFDNRVLRLDDDFTFTDLGTVSGTDKVTIARNNASTPDIVCVSSEGVTNLFVSSAPTAFADTDLPAPLAVCTVKNYFVFIIGDGRIFASQLNDTEVASNSFTTYQGRPGGLLAGVDFGGELIVFGQSGGAVYRDVGASPFPFEFLTDFPKGIIGTHAVAGQEPGWANQLIWAADDNVVYTLSGYNPVPISTDDVSRDIAQAVADMQGSTLEATVHMEGRNAIWRLTNPGVWTWEYNATTGNWNQRQSYGRDDCRASSSVRAFGMWLAGDRTTGKIFDIDVNHYREGADVLPYTLRSGPAAQFPAREQVARMDFDFTAAVGTASGEDPIEVDPSVLIRWSKDGGFSFGNWVQRRLGQQGEGNNRVTVLRGPITGPKGICVEVEVTDPVHAGFMGGELAIIGRAE